MGTRKKKDRRNRKRFTENHGPQAGHRLAESLRDSRFYKMNTSTVQRLLCEEYTWFSVPKEGFNRAECAGREYVLPMETASDEQQHHLVLVHEEAVYPDTYDFLRKMGMLIEDPDDPDDNYMVYPVLVPTDLIPEQHRGQLVSLTSPLFDAKALAVAQPLKMGPIATVVVDANHWWFDASGRAFEKALAVAFEVNFGPVGVA